MQRKIIGNGSIETKDYRKSSSGFVSDVTMNNFVSPAFVKLRDEDAWQLYGGNEWVNATVNQIIDDCTKLSPTITLKDKDSEIKPRHYRVIQEINDFFIAVNDNGESFKDIRKKFIRDMLVFGRGTNEKVLSKQGSKLREVYSLRASTVDVRTNQHGMIPERNAYVQKTSSGESTGFDKEQIMWGVFRPVSGSAYGEKPLDVLANAVASDILRATYNSNFFINGAEASGVLSLSGMSKSELQRFRQYWRDKHKGVKNAHRMLAVNVPIEYVKMAMSNRDLEFSEYGKELRMKIFAVFHMQPMVMGVVDSTTGKLNSEQQIQVYKDSAVKPVLQKEAELYTKQILWDGFGYDDFVVTFEGIDLADAVKQAEIDRLDIGTGLITINEVRQRRGLKPVPWGNTPISVLPGGGQVDPETGQLIPPSEQNNGGGESSNEGEDEEDEEDKSFAEDICDIIKFSIENNSIGSGVNKIEKLLSSDYTDDVAKQAVYEGIICEIKERYKSVNTISMDFVDKLTSAFLKLRECENDKKEN